MNKLILFILAVIVLSSVVSAECVGNACIAEQANQYKFDNAYTDTWGSLDATGVNSPTFSNDEFGNALEAVAVAGVNQYVTTGSSNLIDGDADFTIMFKSLRVDNDADTNGAVTLYGEYVAGNNDRWGFDFTDASYAGIGDGMRFFYRASGVTKINLDCDYDWINTNWYNVTFIRKGTRFNFFVNEDLICNLTDGDTTAANTGGVRIGAFTFDVTPTKFYDGRISEINTWNDALEPNSMFQFLRDGTYIYVPPPPPAGAKYTITALSNRTSTALNNFTASLYNTTHVFTNTTTTGNISFNISEGGTGNYTLNISSGGYAFKQVPLFDINNSNSIIVYLNENNSIYISIYDGVGLYLLNNTEIDIIVDGNTTPYYLTTSTTNGTFFLNDLNADTYSFGFSSPDYPEQNYIVTLADNEHKVLDAYILNLTYIANVIPTVIDPYGQTLEGALISMQQLIGGVYTTIAQETTDITGSSLFYLRIGTNYKANIDKTGYSSQSATITPTSDPYTVTLKLSPILTYNYTIPLECLSLYQITPTTAYLSPGAYNFTLKVNSPDGELNNFGVYFNSSENVDINTMPTGSTARLEMNFSNVSESITMNYYFKCSGYPIYWENVTFLIKNVNSTNSTIENSLLSAAAVTSALQKLAIILVTIIIFLFIAWELGLPSVAYPFIIIIILSIFTVQPIAFIEPYVSIPIIILLGVGVFANWREGGNYG